MLVHDHFTVLQRGETPMVTRAKKAVVRSVPKPRRASILADAGSDLQRDKLRLRALELLGMEVHFIYSSEFESLDEDNSAIVDAEEVLNLLHVRSTESAKVVANNPLVASTEAAASHNWSAPDPLLTFEQEQTLFRSLNLLRFRINRLRSRLSATNPSRKTVREIEASILLIERIRQQLVSSNLRLVSSIARRFSSTFTDVDDFSSDGCMILLGAIDRFDYSRRLRFSTYATHSIQRHFFRAWKVRQRRKERFSNADAALLSEVPQQEEESPICEDPESLVQQLLIQADDVLDQREHQILRDRFGLSGHDRKGRTLREIAADLGISKERVRQLQMKALGKLREILDPNHANEDCLPGLC